MPPLSSHGTVLRKNTTAAPMVFTPVADIGDITPPGLSRNEHETMSHNRDIDYYVAGVLRRQPVTFPVWFNKNEGTHDHLTGLYKEILDNRLVGWKITQPDTMEWIFSGYVTNIQPTAVVDGVQTAQVTIRASGAMYVAGVLVGANVT